MSEQSQNHAREVGSMSKAERDAFVAGGHWREQRTGYVQGMTAFEEAQFETEALRRYPDDAPPAVKRAAEELLGALREAKEVMALVAAARRVVRHKNDIPGLDAEVDSVDMDYLIEALLPFRIGEKP